MSLLFELRYVAVMECTAPLPPLMDREPCLDPEEKAEREISACGSQGWVEGELRGGLRDE